MHRRRCASSAPDMNTPARRPQYSGTETTCRRRSKGIIGLILEPRENEFLVPSRVLTELSGRQRKYLSIRDLDTPGLEKLIEGHIDAFSGLQPSDSERWGFFKTDLRADLLRRLPIHDRSDGTVGSAEGVFRKDAGWSIPDRFRDWVLTVRLIDDPETRAKQKRVIRTWVSASTDRISLVSDRIPSLPGGSTHRNIKIA